MDELNYDYADDEEGANLFNTEPSARADEEQATVPEYMEDQPADSTAKDDSEVATENIDYDNEFHRSQYSNHRSE